MASYVSPSPAEIITYTGLNPLAFDITTAELEDYLQGVLAFCQTEVRRRVGATSFDRTDLEDEQVTGIQIAIIWEAARWGWRWLKSQVLQGTQAPLLMENSAAFDEAIADALTWRDEAIAALVEELGEATVDVTDLETGTLSLPFASQSPWEQYQGDLIASVG
jgi:hypothetical protein